jgi:SAM-dependent methyltransferase
LHCSFRDPDGFVFRDGGRILRCVFPHAVENLRAFLGSEVARTWVSERVLCPATIVPAEDSTNWPASVACRVRDGAILVEHQPIWFPNYPYEWPPEMLRAAGEATLRLARGALETGFGLKDATPYNIMFDGPRAIFIDLLSFERRDPLEAIWPAYAQFVRTFVYPLMATRYGVQIGELLLVHRDGLEPRRIAQLLGARRWLPPFLGSVALPALLSRDQNGVSSNTALARKARDPREAQFVLASRLEKALRLLPKVPSRATESEYTGANCIYNPSEWSAKEKKIAEMLHRFRPERVLDVGCNAGHFSTLAAQAGARVVALDRDPSVVGAVWKSAMRSGLPILPLVIDIARPSGACGWANSECLSFLDRARGRFDCVLMLALTHHLIVSERIPLNQIFDLASQLTNRLLIVEYVDPSDPQFRTIARGRDALHRDLIPEAFENAARERFEIVDAQPVTPTRVIYTLARKDN